MKPVTEESGDPSVRIRFLFSEAVFVSERGKLNIAIAAARWSKLLVVSKRIYANHYFDASLAVTAFGRNPNANGESYLFYENRSRFDGLNGLFGKLERGVIEGQAVDNLTTILEKSKASLMARTSGQPEAPVAAISMGSNWKRHISAVTQGVFTDFVNFGVRSIAAAW